MTETDQLADVIVAAVKAALGPLRDRIKALEERPELRYLGAHTDGHKYAAGVLITRSGGLWLAERDTDGLPGREGSGWRLIVKRGQA